MLGDEILAKLESGARNEFGRAVNTKTPIQVYISFVGAFNEADPIPVVSKWEEKTIWDELFPTAEDEDRITDYYRELAGAERKTIYRKIKLENWTIREQTSKDTLTVTIYNDPQGKFDWGIIVADCPEGGWIDAYRVNLHSFVGGAFVPFGCEVRILDDKEL